MADADDSAETDAWIARKLLRAARQATLATADGAAPYAAPYAALATPACLPDGSVALLLSSLSEHTRQLAANPLCALLVTGKASAPNPQTTPRLTLLAEAARDDDPAVRARFLAIHPYANLYAGFGDFALWRLVPTGGHFVGGFARAARLPAAELRPDAAALAALGAAEAGIMTHCNADHADAMARIAVAAGAPDGAWRMVTADTDGCDLAPADSEALTLRIHWRAPVPDARAVRTELVRLARPQHATGESLDGSGTAS